MVSKIIILINDKTNAEIITKNGLEIGLISRAPMLICCPVVGPIDWPIFSRSAKDKYPDCKRNIAWAKEKMDAMLRVFRQAGVLATKRIIMIDSSPFSLGNDEHDLIVSDRKELLEQIPQNSPQLFLNGIFQLEKIEDMVLMSAFSNQPTQKTAFYIGLFRKKADFHTHLLRVNTPDKFESTTESIEKMKAAIQASCLQKTHIHVYNAAYAATGLAEFIALKNVDFVVVECNQVEIFYGQWTQNTPILFLP